MFPSFPTLVITDLVFPFITTNTLLLDTHLHTKEKITKNCKRNYKKTKKLKVLSKITKIIDTHSLCEEGKPIQRKLSGA